MNTLNAYLDAGGVSLIDVTGDADLNNIVLGIGVTNGHDGRVGDTYPLVRVPQVNTINLTGLVVTNLSIVDGWTFTSYPLLNSGGYDWLIIECLTTYPKASCIMIR